MASEFCNGAFESKSSVQTYVLYSWWSEVKELGNVIIENISI